MDEILRLADEALALYDKTPQNVAIKDADTILKDIMDRSDFEISGIGAELISLFKATGDKEAFMEAFELFASVTFENYLKKCLGETTKGAAV